MSYMKKGTKHSMTGNRVGKKRGNPAKSEELYSIYSSCYDCPLKVYIEIVCNNNLDALIISGNPPKTVLEDANNKIISGYAELSGSSISTRYNVLLKDIYSYRSQIVGLTLCLQILPITPDAAVGNLSKLGMRCSIPENNEDMDRLIRKIDSRIKDRSIRLKKAQKEFDSIQKSNKSKAITPNDFYDQLAIISRWAGFRISVDITLAEYAVYIKQMSEYVEQSKSMINGKKY